MISRSPTDVACCIECVTMSVVSRSPATTFSVRAITWSALFGSSAAVCSSSSSKFGFSQVAMRRVRACRWPPDRLPMMLSNRSSRPILRRATAFRISLRRRDVSAQPNPRDRPRRAASDRFSAIVRFGDVPLNGFWNTRPINLARRNSGHAVTSWPAIRTLPLSTKNVPAIAFSNVDLPDPFVPITTTNDPPSSVRSTPCSDRTSLGPPGLNVFVTFCSLSMRHRHPLRSKLYQEVRNDKRDEYEQGRDQLEIVRVQPPPQRDRDE